MSPTCSAEPGPIVPSGLPMSSTLLVETPDQLAAIRAPGVNLCVWRRDVSPQLHRYIQAVVTCRNIKQTAVTHTEPPDVDELLQCLPDEAERELFGADLRELVRLYGAATGARRAALKLESFGGNLCESFHVDWVGVRLICSYSGPGTEWLDNAQVNRDRLGPGGKGLPDEVSGLLLPGARIGRMERFAIGLMKGERWPGNGGKGLIHRSPRILGSGERRVLFKIDGLGEGSGSPEGS